MRWNESHARRLTRKVDRLLHQMLRQLRSGKPSPPGEFFARLEILRAEKRAAYEIRDMERYEAALNEMATSARRYLASAHKEGDRDKL